MLELWHFYHSTFHSTFEETVDMCRFWATLPSWNRHGLCGSIWDFAVRHVQDPPYSGFFLNCSPIQCHDPKRYLMGGIRVWSGRILLQWLPWQPVTSKQQRQLRRSCTVSLVSGAGFAKMIPTASSTSGWTVTTSSVPGGSWKHVDRITWGNYSKLWKTERHGISFQN